MTFHHPLFAASVFFAAGALAQNRHDLSLQSSSVTVHVELPASRTCVASTQVTLLAASGIRVADAYTNSQCYVSFNNLAAGNYRVVVSTSGAERADMSFDVSAGLPAEIDVPVKNESGAPSAYSRSPLVSTGELKIPDAARQEFDKATQSMTKQNWKQASEQLRKAVTIYPQYAQAYNNLGVAYSHTENPAEERQALQKAIDLDDHFAPPLVNLARMAIAGRDMNGAESLLNRAAAIDPEDTTTLVLLANVELLTQHFPEALETSRRAHSHGKDPHALVHMVAARIYRMQNRNSEAATELRTFLSEEPSGPRADAVKKEIASLKVSP